MSSRTRWGAAVATAVLFAVFLAAGFAESHATGPSLAPGALPNPGDQQHPELIVSYDQYRQYTDTTVELLALPAATSG